MLVLEKKFLNRRKRAIIYAVVVFFVLAGISTYYYSLPRNYNQIFGVSFDWNYAKFLNLNPQLVYHKILNDWGFKYVRLSAHWDELEGVEGNYNFTELDWLMNKTAEHSGHVTLVLGQKTLRWPECHLPDWSREKNPTEYREALLGYMTAVVERYKNHPALEVWQVENEPFLKFGECPKYNAKMLDEEIALVKQIDPDHQILITDSGELSTWQRTARRGDLFGSTLYRVVWNEKVGYFNYDWVPAAFYKFKLWIAGRDIDDSFISELQSEPWVPDMDVKEMGLEDQMKSMSPVRFQTNIDYAQRVGFSRAYLWGAEWWYWLAANKGVLYFDTIAKSLNKY